MKRRNKKFSSDLIAPCGMNCGICVAHLREKNRCEGCRIDKKRKNCAKCSIKNCENLKNNFCSEKCIKFPCKKLKNLDERYRENYDMSMIKNLKTIEKEGLKVFLDKQNKKYICQEGIICIHNKKIYK